MRTPWHHLISYQSLVFGMYRHACRSYPLLGTTSAAIKAWFRACIANACSSYALLGTTSAAISSSPIVAVRIALKRSFVDLSLLKPPSNGRCFCFHLHTSVQMCKCANHTSVQMCKCANQKQVCKIICTQLNFLFPCRCQRPRPRRRSGRTSSGCSKVPTQARPQLRAHGVKRRRKETWAFVRIYTELRKVKTMRRLESAQRRPHPAVLHADGFAAETRPRGRGLDLVPHEEPRAFDPKIPDLAGASRRLPAAQQVSAGTSRCLASGYTSVCALRSQLDPSRTRPPLWLRAFVSTEVSRCNALPRVSLYPSTFILGTEAPRIVVPFPACASPSM